MYDKPPFLDDAFVGLGCLILIVGSIFLWALIALIAFGIYKLVT